jgi:hypothetical protein
MNTNKVLNKVPRKVWMIGKENFLLPFIAQGFCICDKSGRVVGEARSMEVAQDMVKMMNNIAQA